MKTNNTLENKDNEKQGTASASCRRSRTVLTFMATLLLMAAGQTVAQTFETGDFVPLRVFLKKSA